MVGFGGAILFGVAGLVFVRMAGWEETRALPWRPEAG